MIRETEPQRTFGELDLERNEFETNVNTVPPYEQRINEEKPNFLKNRLDFLSKKMVFRFRPEAHVSYDAKKLLMLSLLMVLIEFTIYFAFQLLSYFLLDDFWHDARFIPGVILGPIYGVLAILLVLLSNVKRKAIVYCLKVLEFLTAFFLLGYLAPHDFATVSLSYIMMLDIILIYLFVS